MIKKRILQATMLSAAFLAVGTGSVFVADNQATSNKVYAATSNKWTLVKAINKAQEFHSQYWTASTFNQLQAALNNARKVNNQWNANQWQVNQATNTLQRAINNMRRQVGVNKSGLQQQIGWSSSYNASNYTKLSFTNLQRLLGQGRAIYNNPQATQADVDNIIWQMHNAGLNLVSLVPLRTQLGYSTSYQAQYYTPYSFKVLKNEINYGSWTLVNPNATQWDVNNAIKVLHNAGLNLTPSLPSLTYTQPSGTSISISKFSNIKNGGKVIFDNTSFDQSPVFDLMGNYGDGITNIPESFYFKPSQNDVNTPINPTNLTASQALDLANFAAGMVNTVRAQIGQTLLSVTGDSQNEAATVAKNYGLDNWHGFNHPVTAPHDFNALNNANAQFGKYNLDGECMSYTLDVAVPYLINHYGSNMATAKLGLAFDIVRMMYDDGGVNNYGHEKNLLDLDNNGSLISRQTSYLGLATDKYGAFHIATMHALMPDEKQGVFK
ncbi:SEC10/PgrA surface exclusion domain-containing protein [Periweissella fabalis]|uniref:SEC10/PgrA surface exclusion domain-containing protein n=1 Tax=Periweissella fabalis TaxID=1070421 RepID=A0A7X6N4B3_9LACO|nr:SEC10/PgrA surface exclusion domain-containing protein [Periweissella fabalis]MCM0599384.1 SEC10/PgrA surface exclusion domain-containing protein [Periweissella fabalis]NKZ23663.1 SEC10/PgrA surface exclusion domain-containing protein [Periweissella fabalis]